MAFRSFILELPGTGKQSLCYLQSPSLLPFLCVMDKKERTTLGIHCILMIESYIPNSISKGGERDLERERESCRSHQFQHSTQQRYSEVEGVAQTLRSGSSAPQLALR